MGACTPIPLGICFSELADLSSSINLPRYTRRPLEDVPLTCPGHRQALHQQQERLSQTGNECLRGCTDMVDEYFCCKHGHSMRFCCGSLKFRILRVAEVEPFNSFHYHAFLNDSILGHTQ
jgi:hypothetical protein